ncbi:MAG TPA: hypothetical protein VGI78_19510 [Acetobacteraceae bacterium]
MTRTLQLLSLAALLTTGAVSATLAATNDAGSATSQPAQGTQMGTPPGSVVTTTNPTPNEQIAHAPGQPNLALPGAGTQKGGNSDASDKGSSAGSKQ